STTAAEAKPALRWIGSLKKSRKYPFERGWCCASSPDVNETSANASSGTATQRYDRRSTRGWAAPADTVSPTASIPPHSVARGKRRRGEAQPRGAARWPAARFSHVAACCCQTDCR